MSHPHLPCHLVLAIQAVAAAVVGMEAEALDHAPRGPGPGLGHQTAARDPERSRSLRLGAAQGSAFALGCCRAAQRLEKAKQRWYHDDVVGIDLETSPVERIWRVMATDGETSSVEVAFQKSATAPNQEPKHPE